MSSNGAQLEWHRWYAWHPVRTIAGRLRWLCNLERRRSYYGGGGFYYRDIGGAP